MSNYNVIQAPSIGHIVKAWTKGVELDERAIVQLQNVASLPFIYKWVAAMPDAHWGMGATVGSVIATKSAIVPAAVGVDLGCGMVAARTSYTANDLPESLRELRASIERAIPVGGPGETGSWKENGRYGPPASVSSAWVRMFEGYEKILARHPKIKGGLTEDQLGTLGTGNHFIEVCLDKESRVWVMLHSGSRGVGNRIASYFIEHAKQDMRRWYINLPDQDLAYIPEGSEFFGDYWNAIKWAQDFAAVNRELMLERALTALKDNLSAIPGHLTDLMVNCHHNYVAKEHHYGENVWVTRKGAVRAQVGDMGIIPGSMGARSFIVRGLGNPESFNSCSHGAGRVMSRGEAKRRISLEEHARAVAGVECRLDEDVIDESPAAYKNIDAVMTAQSDLVEIVHELKQVLCVKG